jgi:hypothetical protein
MRVRSPITRISRVTRQDTEVCGVRIPKGNTVGVVNWALNKLSVFGVRMLGNLILRGGLLAKIKRMAGRQIT